MVPTMEQPPLHRGTATNELNVLRTNRLELREIAVDDAKHLVAGEKLAGQRWADGYPLEGTLVAAGMLIRAAEKKAPAAGFGMYQIFDAASGLVVGDIGFHAAPDAHGTVEVGYGVATQYWGRGIASHALRTLTKWALSQPQVKTVIARTEVDYEASRRVLEAAGFDLVEIDQGTCRYRRLPQRIL
jgi:RimJ/RimL family protein N-acetyltransferase